MKSIDKRTIDEFVRHSVGYCRVFFENIKLKESLVDYRELAFKNKSVLQNESLKRWRPFCELFTRE